MKKKAIRIIALIFALTLILSTVVFAAVSSSPYIAATSAWITRDGDTVNVNFFIVGRNTMDMIGVKYVYLYELNGSTWNLVKTFNYTNPIYTATMVNYNSGAKAAYLSYSGSSSKTYFADCRFYAEKDGGSDTIPQDTPTSYGTLPPGP